jgi:hypothetical protein
MRNVLAVLIIGCATLWAQAPAQPPCAAPEFRQFDFWVGEWEASWDKNASMPAGKGANHITKGFDGCVIEEQFDGVQAIGLRGMSVSTYVPQAQQWKQTWVDNQGGYLDFSGGFKDGQMILVREATGPQGKKFHQRMVWKNITKQKFDWSWEASRDGGQTWTVNWAIVYTRKTSAAK